MYEYIVKLLERDSTCEQQRMYGVLHPTKKFYIIRNFRTNSGLMGIHNIVLSHIIYAINNGYIPVVDMKNYASMYHEESELGSVNTWEYYFEQPMHYTLEEAYKSFYVTLCKEGKQPMPFGQNQFDNKQDIAFCNSIMSQYMDFNASTKQILSDELSKLKNFAQNGKILGVCCRGSDYATLKPKYHHIPTTAEESIELVKEKLEKWDGYKYVYLATEDETILEKFKTAFCDSGNLYYVECKRFPSDTGNRLLADIEFERENDKYLRGLEYLKTLHLLSKCDSAILPQIGGTLAALRMNNNQYEHTILLDKGCYE
ncbi:MAG: hypothetical protein R3Y67_09920 [Eubacteriales bacterium]